MALTLWQVKLATPLQCIEKAAVTIEDDGTIVYAGPTANAPDLGGERVVLDGYTIAPGFIDIHTHGARHHLWRRREPRGRTPSPIPPGLQQQAWPASY